MSFRHVIYLSNIPTFREPVTITVNVPAGVSDSFPIEMNFPIDILEDPSQITAAPIVPGFTPPRGQVVQPPQPVFQSSQPTRISQIPTSQQQQFISTQPTTINPPISSPMSNTLSGLSPDQPL